MACSEGQDVNVGYPALDREIEELCAKCNSEAQSGGQEVRES
jgi:hypothetical protein